MSALLERVVVIGAQGQLGSELMAALAPHRPYGPARAEFDLTDRAAVRRLFDERRPSLVVNCAAFHQVETCESEPATAFAVNALAVDALAAECARAGAAFAHVSTDYVFDGETRRPYDEGDAARPLNAYGASKLAGEALLQRHGERWFVFRTSGLFGLNGRSGKGLNFVERMLRGAELDQPLRVVDDLVFAPSYAPHVARAIVELAADNEFGLYHLTNAGACSWWDLAVEALRAAGHAREVEPIRSQHVPGKARRPAFSALAPGELERRGRPSLPSWRDGVRAYVAARTHAGDRA
jgi:dTDP-4-dehydrorhamnose reductase